MQRHAPATPGLDQRIRAAERELFTDLGADVEKFFIELGRTGGRVRVLSHGQGPAIVLLHGVALSAAIWAPLFKEFPQHQLFAVDLPGHGLSDPVTFRRGQVREQAGRIIDDILDGLILDEAPVIGHSLGGMFALWQLASGSQRISSLVAMGAPAVALAGVRVRMPLSLMTVRGVGPALLRSPTPRPVFRRLLAQGLGSADAAAAPPALVDAVRLSARRPANARSVAALMHAIDRFRVPRTESVLTDGELAAIRVPTVFVLGSDDPYLSVERARQSVQQIPGATIHEVRAGHAPWLVDPSGSALRAAQPRVQQPSTTSARRPSW